MLRIVLIIVGLASVYNLNGQDISSATLQWNATGFRDLDASKDFTNSCQFITYGTKRVEWIQDQGNHVREWTIKQAQGNWSNVAAQGSYQYTFNDGAINGELTISKDAGGWVIDLVLLGGTNDVKLKYTVNSVEKL